MLALDRMDNGALARYLAAQGVLADSAPLTVEALGGGVSNIVLRVTTPAQCWVLKQALPELRVAAYWPSRIDRAVREAEALRVVSGHLPSGAVPTVHFIDEENYIYGMSCAPDSATLWKENLLAGEVELPVAAAAGRVLAQMHAIQDPAVRERFIDDEVFWQLRVDPYYNTIAEKYPSVKPVVARAIAQMKARKLALVHGDYSPKNMFVLREKMDSRADPYSEHDSSGYESGKEKMDFPLSRGMTEWVRRQSAVAAKARYPAPIPYSCSTSRWCTGAIRRLTWPFASIICSSSPSSMRMCKQRTFRQFRQCWKHIVTNCRQ